MGAIANFWLFGAGIAAGITALIHIIAGGREIAAPLLASRDMHSVAKYTNYYCWHLVSITLIAMCAGLIWPAYDPAQSGLAVMWVVIAALFCFWSLLLVTWKKQSFLLMPQWSLFAVIAGLGLTGLFAG